MSAARIPASARSMPVQFHIVGIGLSFRYDTLEGAPACDDALGQAMTTYRITVVWTALALLCSIAEHCSAPTGNAQETNPDIEMNPTAHGAKPSSPIKAIINSPDSLEIVKEVKSAGHATKSTAVSD